MGQFGVPNPVTGSQPVVALKPSVPHPGFAPSVISFSTRGFAYNTESMNPTVLLALESSLSLISVMIEPKAGDEADVP
jgi:hypothetical protein